MKVQAQSCKAVVNTLIPEEIKAALISVDDFIKEYTVNGLVYHGTSMAHARDFIKTQEVAWRAGSPGFFVTNDYWGTAFNYGPSRYSAYGVIMPIRFSNLHNLRVLDLSLIDGKRLDELLKNHSNVDYGSAEESIYYDAFGINAVITEKGVVSVHNSEVIIFPRSLLESARLFLNDHDRWKDDGATWASYYKLYESLTEDEKDQLVDPQSIKPEGYVYRELF